VPISCRNVHVKRKTELSAASLMLFESSEKAARIKAARDEAQAEISKFRQQMEQEFQTAQFGVDSAQSIQLCRSFV
jgi:hypothetical protein